MECDFLARMKASDLQAAVQQVRVRANLSASFKAAGALNTANNRLGGRAGRGSQGRGNADNNGHGHGHGVQGNGRGQGRGQLNGRGTTHTGYYSQQGWNSLTTQVLEARGTKHSINGVEITIQGYDVASAITDFQECTIPMLMLMALMEMKIQAVMPRYMLEANLVESQ